MPKLDEVPRKRRKFLDASTMVNLPQLPVAKLVTLVVVNVTEAQLALPASGSFMEEAPLVL